MRHLDNTHWETLLPQIVSSMNKAKHASLGGLSPVNLTSDEKAAQIDVALGFKNLPRYHDFFFNDRKEIEISGPLVVGDFVHICLPDPRVRGFHVQVRKSDACIQLSYGSNPCTYPLELWFAFEKAIALMALATFEYLHAHPHTVLRDFRRLAYAENTHVHGLCDLSLVSNHPTNGSLPKFSFGFQYGPIKQVRRIDGSAFPRLYFLKDLKGKNDPFSYYFEASSAIFALIHNHLTIDYYSVGAKEVPASN